MESTTVFQVRQYVDADYWVQVGGLFETAEKATQFINTQRSRCQEEYKIFSVTTQTQMIGIVTVPAYFPSLEEIADEIIKGSDGSFSVDWGKDFERLSEAEQQIVQDMVHEQVTDCAHCGWHWQLGHLEEVDGQGLLCWQCVSNHYDSLEDKEEEE